MITLTDEQALQIEEDIIEAQQYLGSYKIGQKTLTIIRIARGLQQHEHREPTHDEYLELAKNADIVVAHEHCHLSEREMKKAWVVEYGSQVYARAWIAGLDSAQPVQDPVALVSALYPDGVEWFKCVPEGTKLYAAPVHTKDLTDDEIYPLYNEPTSDKEAIEFARAVIAADREKNK